MVFDLSEPAVRAIKSPMGGGWVIGLTEEGKQTLEEYFGESPVAIPVADEQSGFSFGYIVEPQDAEDLANYLRAEGIAWEIG